MEQQPGETAPDDAAALHRALIDELKRDGRLDDERIERAFREIPRHIFLPDTPLQDVYRDNAIVTRREEETPLSSSSQPSMMAIMLLQLDLQPGHRVLEIGAATGYNAALMSTLVGPEGLVVTIDIDEDLVVSAREHLAAAGITNVVAICADGGFGYPAYAPYDRIILTVGAWDIAPAWREQLGAAGRLVLPLSLIGEFQRSIAFEHDGDCLVSRTISNCAFVILRGEFGRPEPEKIPIGQIPEMFLILDAGDRRQMKIPELDRLFERPWHDLPTGIELSERDIYFRLLRWLELRAPDLCTLYATGEALELGVVPYLFGRKGKVHASMGLVRDGAAAMLHRADAIPTASDGTSSDGNDRGISPLIVRRYGDTDRPAHQLLDLLALWDTSGRPAEEQGLRVYACPKGKEHVPEDNELVIDKRWTRLILQWRP